MSFGDLTPALLSAALAQVILLIVGLVILWRVQFSGTHSIRWKSARLEPWEISGFDFLLACMVVMGGGLLGQGVLAAALRPLLEPFGPDVRLVGTGASFQLGLLVGVVIATWLTRRRATAAKPDRAIRRPGALLAGAATLAAAMPILVAVSVGWNALLEVLGFSVAKQELVDLFARADSPALALAVASLAVFVAPVAEELLFRAGLFRYLRTRVPRPFALGIPAVVFASLHGNVAAFAPLVALGVIFALAYERTGRIAVPMIAHSLFNLNTILLLLAGVTV